MHERAKLLFKNSRYYGKGDRRLRTRRESNKIQVKKEGETITFQKRGMSSALEDIWNGTFAVEGEACPVPKCPLIRTHFAAGMQCRAFRLHVTRFAAKSD